MDAKMAKEVREMVYEAGAEQLELGTFEFVGRGSEGLVFADAEGEVLVVRAIVKAEGTVAEDLVAEFQAKQEKAALKAAEREAKKAKDKAKAEKEKETETE